MLINTLILIMKQCVYATKCKEQRLNFIDFLAQVNYYYNIEKIASYSSTHSLLKNGKSM